VTLPRPTSLQRREDRPLWQNDIPDIPEPEIVKGHGHRIIGEIGAAAPPRPEPDIAPRVFGIVDKVDRYIIGIKGKLRSLGD
jgi:hypothetical protein